MTQVPRPLSPADALVVPGDASTPDSPAAGQPAVSAATQELAARLARVIDPDVWAAREEDQVNLGSKWDFKIRRMNSEREASRILADAELLDALVAYRQQQLALSVPGTGCGACCWCQNETQRAVHELNPAARLPDWGMIVCPNCGNKRCPKATHHNHVCTLSNEPGQSGSIYGYFTLDISWLDTKGESNAE